MIDVRHLELSTKRIFFTEMSNRNNFVDSSNRLIRSFAQVSRNEKNCQKVDTISDVRIHKTFYNKRDTQMYSRSNIF